MLKAKIIDKSELRKSQMQRDAEALLGKLTSDKAIEVSLADTSSRTVRRAFNLAAAATGIEIRMRKRGSNLFVLRK